MFARPYKQLREHPVLALALLITLLVYARFLFFGHISWDDPEMVFRNKDVKNFDLRAFFSKHYVGNYIPVTMLLHSLTWQLFGNNDAAHHLLNILLHLVNGILIYHIGKHLFKNEMIATGAAILFLLHPVQAESVGWISELKNIASTTFSLIAILKYLRFKENRNKKYYIWTFVFFIIGCLCKSSVVALPLTLLCLDCILEKRFTAAFFVNKLPMLVVSVIIGYINIRTQRADLFINHAHEFPYYQRIALAGFALVKYLILFLIPAQLSVIYPYPELKIPVFILGAVALLVILASLIALIRKKNLPLAALILLVLFNIMLVLQVIPFGEVLYADRYLYVPLIGLSWILMLLISKTSLKPQWIGVALILILSLITFAGNARWKNAITLYEDILKQYPNQFVALNSAGVESMFLNEDEKALGYFNKAIDAAPRNYKSYYNRGLLFLKSQKPELAIKSFNQALDLYSYNKALTGRASAYYMLGDMPKAIQDAGFVLRSEPENAKAHFVLGNCYNDMNRLAEAMQEYNICIRLNPEDADYYFKRAIVFGKQQDFRTCISDLTVCLELNPGYYQAHYWLGVAKVNLKQEPCEDFRIAAEQNYSPAVSAYNRYCH